MYVCMYVLCIKIQTSIHPDGRLTNIENLYENNIFLLKTMKRLKTEELETGSNKKPIYKNSLLLFVSNSIYGGNMIRENVEGFYLLYEILCPEKCFSL